MAITLADFNKIWASTSPLTPYSFSESNYKQGWNFIGSTPPARQMWDFLQKNNDEKMQYLANNYLPLTGGTMSGAITRSGGAVVANTSNNASALYLNAFSDGTNGAQLGLYGKDHAGIGRFSLNAMNGNTIKSLNGYPDGTLTWGEKILSAPSGRILTASGTVEAVQNTYVEVTSVTLDKTISDKWMVLANCRISQNVANTFGVNITYGSIYTAVRFDGTNGGGAVNACYFEISSNAVVKLNAYSPSATSLNFIGVMWAIPLM